MRRDKPNADEPLLFDLPLAGPGEEAPAGPSPEERKRPARTARAAVADEPPPASRRGPVPVPRPELEDGPDDEPLPASEYAGRGRRLAAGAADLLVHAAVGVLALAGTRGLGVRPTVADWPALAVFLLSFSFLYTLLPLAFWGHTLGMAWSGITSRNRDGEPLTFDQTARRWLGGILTVAALGLPLLATGDRRRALTDVLSGSATYPEEGPV
jgi:uncharacterized RDD family membrane protein YckC